MLNCELFMTSQIESFQDFFYQVGHETTYASSGNKHFSLNNVTKIMNRKKIGTIRPIFNTEKWLWKSEFSDVWVGCS